MSTEEPRTESTPQRSEASPEAVAAAKRFGAPMIVRGILGVVFGIVTVFWPRDATNPAQLRLPTDVVDHLAIAYLILFALVLVFEAVRAPLTMRTAIYGQAVITVPAIVFLFLADQPAELRAALSIWALLHGALEFWSYRQLRSQPMASDFLIAAGVHVLLGVILIFGDGMEALSILGFTGAATLIAGVIFIIGGYSRLSKARQLARRTGRSDLADRPEQIDTPTEATASTSASDDAKSAPASARVDDESDIADTPVAETADTKTSDTTAADPTATSSGSAAGPSDDEAPAGDETPAADSDPSDIETSDDETPDETATKNEP
ncbi:HdeD family acid-resistance protein [Brevibacterium oceani]|uniref:HdeD family acid-resistance protein n=1 Tax=Brevibacterium oceani TaxID=358099 RepID=UPI001B3437DE|nr:hypothetical protein [Brevibacterium oceani]